MSIHTTSVEWLLARAAVRETGLLHVVSRRDSGALNPICGARTLLSEKIEEQHHLDDVALLCDGCATIAASIGGTIPDGVALLLGLNSAASTVRLLELPIAALDLRQAHTRQHPGDLTDLTASIRERGVVAPVIARRVRGRFEIIDGARRVAAAHLAGHTTVPAIVKDATDRDVVLDALIANLHRDAPNPIEQAHAYQHAIDVLGLSSKAELGRLLGISREQVSNTIRLLNLPEDDQDRLRGGQLTAEGGRALLRGTQPAAAKLTDVSALLTQLLAATVAVTARGDRTRIVIDVDSADRDRVLTQLGIAE